MRSAILILAIVAGPAASGEIYRCVAANGDVSYTNLACPDRSKVETVAKYEPDDWVPPAAANSESTRAAEDSAAEAREAALQAREAALAARIASEQARAEQSEREVEPATYSPLFVPAYLPSVPRYRGGGHRDHHRHDPVIHLEGPETPVRPPQWAGATGDRQAAAAREHH